jgi:hypothetical protein
MSCTASAAWSHPILSLCCTKHCLYCGAVLSGHITSVAMSRSGQLDRRCTIEPHCSGLHARLADASVMYERVLETREPSCMSRAAKPFFIHVVHSPLGVVGHVAAPELPSQKGRTRSLGTRGNTRAHLIREVRSGAEGHVAVPELTTARRRGPGPRDTWGRRSPPL